MQAYYIYNNTNKHTQNKQTVLARRPGLQEHLQHLMRELSRMLSHDMQMRQLSHNTSAPTTPLPRKTPAPAISPPCTPAAISTRSQDAVSSI